VYGKVVVPLDGSKLAEGVLSHVAEVIRGQRSKVYLLSVAPLMRGIAPVLVELSSSSANLREERQRTERELLDYLREAGKRLEPVTADVQACVRFGRPAEETLVFANEVKADLLAMSTHGRSGISIWVSGSMVDRVLRGATCPVLLVRADQAGSRATYQRIVVPLDGSELAEQVLPYLKALIRPGQGLKAGTQVFLISVLTAGLGERTVALLTSYPPGLQLAAPTLNHAEIQLRTYLRSVAGVLRGQGATVQTAVRRGLPAEEILAYAAEIEADLIGMTTHGFSGASRWGYGDVASKVLQGARSPVLLVHSTP
jgi:nucleotide-binding universal stress UspA family protein